MEIETFPANVSISSASAYQPSVQLLPSPPLQAFRELDYHAAYMLATLPRKRADDPTSTPLACTLTAAIPAIVAFAGGFQKAAPYFSLDFGGMLYIAIFVGCLAWYVVKRNEERDQKTSLQYLEELRTGVVAPVTAPTSAPWWKIWMR